MTIKKSTAIILLITFLSTIGGNLLFSIKISHATVPVTDDDTHNKLDTIKGVLDEQLKQQRSINKEQKHKRLKEILISIIKKRLLDMLVDDIIRWIQGGGKEPRFVSDWKGFLEDAYQAGVGDVARELGAGFLCEPFSLRVKLVLNPIAVPIFSERVTCTLDKIIGNVEDAYKKFMSDFRNGSWLAYNTMWQPQNNYYGAVMLGWDEMETEGAKRKEAQQSEAIASQGFLSMKECIKPGNKYEVIDTECRGIDITSPEYTKCVNDAIKLTETKYCRQWQVNTPGTVIAGQINKALGSEFDFITNSNDFTQYLAAIIDAAINRLMNEGVKGLRKLSTGDKTKQWAVLGGLFLALVALDKLDFGKLKDLLGDIPIIGDILTGIIDIVGDIVNFFGGLIGLGGNPDLDSIEISKLSKISQENCGNLTTGDELFGCLTDLLDEKLKLLEPNLISIADGEIASYRQAVSNLETAALSNNQALTTLTTLSECQTKKSGSTSQETLNQIEAIKNRLTVNAQTKSTLQEKINQLISFKEEISTLGTDPLEIVTNKINTASQLLDPQKVLEAKEKAESEKTSIQQTLNQTQNDLKTCQQF